jgi:hypothetical protein
MRTGGNSMTHPSRFTIAIAGTAEEGALVVDWEDGQWETLEAYLLYADELYACKLAREGVPVSLNVSYTQETGTCFRAELPDWDDVAVLLHRLRPFVLSEEHASFERTSSLLSRHLPHPLLRQSIKQHRAAYTGQAMQARFVRIAIGDTILNSEQVLKKWLNAYEYHHDQDKRKELESLLGWLPQDFSRAIFVMLLGEKVNAVLALGNFVSVVLGRQKELKLSVATSPKTAK